MHACGHDAHTAILLCLAEALAANRELVQGRVVFLFQEGEEGGGGAEKLVAEGAADGVDGVFGLHVGNAFPVGTVCMSPGTQTASSDSFCIRIQGRGTHGATPHLGINPIAAGAAIVTELGLLQGRLIDPLEPCVVSVCRFASGSTANVIPGDAEIKGTVRCFSDETRRTLLGQIEKRLPKRLRSAGLLLRYRLRLYHARSLQRRKGNAACKSRDRGAGVYCS